ncbi:MAG: DUF1015 family protein [Chitinophagaceae bacterium]
MAVIEPFKALRPQAEYASQVASRPYDVLTAREAKVEAQGNPYSFLHITKAEIDLPEDLDSHSAEVYQKAKENLQAFRQRDVLFKENKPCYYIYRLVMNGREQTGLVCGSSVKDYEKNIIKKHEHTRPEKEEDRINHILATGAQTGNVFLAYRAVDEIDALIDQWKAKNSPVYDFTAEDGIRHSIWVVNQDATIETITGYFASLVPFTYIADGHHRAASAAKAKKALGDQAKPSAAFFLTTLFPSSQLEIMDYNRVIKDMNGLSTSAFLEKTGEKFFVEKQEQAYRPEALHQFGLYIENNWYKLTSRENSFGTDPIGILDITILQENLLDPVLGIKDQRTDTRIDFVGGIKGLKELEKRVNSGEMKIAFSLYPVSIKQLFDIADSDNIMPPKSTWFEPKLRDGLLTHLID